MSEATLLKISEVMKILNVSRRTVYYWIRDGILKPIRIGRVYRFHATDIQALIASKQQEATAKQKKILAVDDDFLVRESLKPLLEKYGFNVTFASNGKEAIALAARERFDLVLTDLKMPEMNGIETLKEIRKQQDAVHAPKVPEIVLTAYDTPELKAEAERMGVRDFIMKPFELNHFIEVLRKNICAA